MRCNKIDNKCFEKVFSTCVEYEKELPEISKIEKRCYSVEDVIQDLYCLINDLKKENNIETIRLGCLYESEEEKSMQDVLIKLSEEICNIKEELNELREQEDNGNNPFESVDNYI